MKRASELAARQFGSIARRQLLRVGFTPTRVRGWIRAERLHPRYPGVYAWGRADLGAEGELAAALLFAGRGAALGGITSLWWRGLLEHRPHRIHVDAPGYKTSRDDVRIRHPSEVAREWHRQLPVAALPQALLCSTAYLGTNSLRLVLARAEFRHQLKLSSVSAVLGTGNPGSSALRAAFAAHLPQLAQCASPLEVDFVLLCERFRIEMPEPNARIGRYRPDMLWRGHRLVVELDGRDAHSTPAQLIADERRAADLRRLGFVVIRFTWRQVKLEAERVAGEVLQRLRGQ